MNEVIIDGVNVAECKELQKVVNEEPYCDSSNTTKMTCKGNNCLFKQLQRAKAENEKLLKEIYINYKNAITDMAINTQLSNMQREISKLLKENERLKAENKMLKAEIEDHKQAIYEFNGSAFDD